MLGVGCFQTKAADLYVNLSGFDLVNTTNRRVLVTGNSLPRGQSSSVVVSDKRAYTTDVDGSFWISNVVQGVYLMEVQAPPARSEFRVLVDSATGTIIAASNLVASANNTYPADTVAWGAAASDARYAFKSELTNNGTGGGVTNNQVLPGIPVTTNGTFAGAFTGSLNGNAISSSTAAGISLDGDNRFGISDIDVYAKSGILELTNFVNGVRAGLFIGTVAGPTTLLTNAAGTALGTAAFTSSASYDVSGAAAAAVANVWTNGTPGNGAGLTNVIATNVVGAPVVINVKDFGAVVSTAASPGSATDSTLAISNAVVALKASGGGGTLYFGNTGSNGYYRVSSTFVFNALDYVNGSPATPGSVQNSSAFIRIVGQNSRIITTSDKPVFAFTNAMNNVLVEGLWISGIGAATATSPGIGIYTDGTGNSPDFYFLNHIVLDGFNDGLYSESGSTLVVNSCDFMYNKRPFALVNTNVATGSNNISGNNNVQFKNSFLGSNYKGGYIKSGGGIAFDNCEGGNSQTNFVTINSENGATVQFKGGNCELWYGAGVEVIGSTPHVVKISQQDWGLINYAPPGQPAVLNVMATNPGTYGPLVSINRSDLGAGSIMSLDNAQVHAFHVASGSTKVTGSNSVVGLFTNYLSATYGQMANLLQMNGASIMPYESSWLVGYGYDAKGRTALSYGAASNWVASANSNTNFGIFTRNVLQYNYDKEDGLIAMTGNVSNYWNVAPWFRMASGAPVTIKQNTVAAGVNRVLTLRGGNNALSSGVAIGARIYNDAESGGELAFMYDTAFSPSGYGSVVMLRPNADTPDGTYTNSAFAKWDGNFHAANAFVSRGSGTVGINQWTNGSASYATNIVLSANAAGYTNSATAPGTGVGKNMIANVIGTSGSIEYWNRSGTLGQTVCGVALYTNTVTASGQNIYVPVNSGFRISSGSGVTIQVYAQ